MVKAGRMDGRTHARTRLNNEEMDACQPTDTTNADSAA